jgi:hypothetical protein
MRQMRNVVTTVGLLVLALVPIIGAASPESPLSVNDEPSRVPVAIAQPLAVMKGNSLVTIPASPKADAMLPESGMLVLVGSALMGLAAVVRKSKF